MRPRVAARCGTPYTGPQGVAIVGIYPCGKAWKTPLFLSAGLYGPVLAVKGSLRRFAPWTAPGRSERRAAYEEKKGGSGRGVRRAS